MYVNVGVLCMCFFMEEGISAGLEFHFDMSFVVINFLSNVKGFDW